MRAECKAECGLGSFRSDLSGLLRGAFQTNEIQPAKPLFIKNTSGRLFVETARRLSLE